MSAVTAKKKKRSPLHPVEQAHIIREARPPTPLMEFIYSLEGEMEYADALREYQQEWCEHPKVEQEVISTLYRLSEEEFTHEIRCGECGLIRKKNGRVSASHR